MDRLGKLKVARVMIIPDGHLTADPAAAPGGGQEEGKEHKGAGATPERGIPR